MGFAEQLRVIQDAHGDPAKLGLSTVDIAYPALSVAERATLKESLEAAAVPHWFDEAMLAALLGIPHEEGATRLALLRRLKVVEPFRARGENVLNVHEATRLALRRHLASAEPAKFRQLSAHAAARFADDGTPKGRTEWVYHLVCAEPQRAADELRQLSQEWVSSARPEDESALATALWELDQSQLVTGRTRAWTLLVIAWAGWSRGEYAQLTAIARQALQLAQETNDRMAESDAQALLGDALQEQGEMAAAQAAYEASLAITYELATQNPRDPVLLRESAAVLGKIGEVLVARGSRTEAEYAFELAVEALRRLVAEDPTNWGWQWDLAATINKLGDVLRQRGEFLQAKAAFEEDLAITRGLLVHDPGNAAWQSGLAGTLGGLGLVLQRLGQLATAQDTMEEGLNIRRRLAVQDPTNRHWQRQLASALHGFASLLEERGDLTGALVAYHQNLQISRPLAAEDPTNIARQRGLAVTCWSIGRAEENLGRRAGALPFYEEADRIFQVLAEQAPEIPQYSDELESLRRELQDCRNGVLKDP